MKRVTDANVVEFLRQTHSFPAGSADDYELFVEDYAMYLLIWNSKFNYAGLSKLDRYLDWESVIFVQSNQHEHIDALDYCEVKDSEKPYYTDEEPDRLDIASLCRDCSEKMAQYFAQWDE